jgi:hypothetical protein
MQFEDILKSTFVFCPVCRGQMTFDHRTGCEYVAAIKAERERCAGIADEVRKRELALYSGRAAYHTIAEEIQHRILDTWNDPSAELKE